VYTQALKRKGITIRPTGDLDILDTVQVGTVMATSPIAVQPGDLLVDVEDNLRRRRSHGAPVVRSGELVGIVTMTDITRADKDLESTTVEDVMTPRPVTVTPTTPVSAALERMTALGVGRLPVVDGSPFRLVGMFGREQAVNAYHEGLTASTDRQLHRARLAQRTEPGAGYYEFRIPVGSMADGRQIREVTWPEGSTLVSIRRNRRVLVPQGDTRLLAGDVVTAFGTESSKRRMIDRLNAGADEPTAEIPVAEYGSPDDDVSDSGMNPSH
ncbi:MAG: CBS domain-containing protein, partial [Halobacteriales archaeon]|nr:CBS domain-containing protein [Halobacteriales archaeon]